MKKIKLFATDVDGTMTDAGMYYTETGIELKKFNTHDGMGIKMLREHGIKTAIITSENTTIVKKRADKLNVDYLSMGNWSKLDYVKNLCTELNISGRRNLRPLCCVEITTSYAGGKSFSFKHWVKRNVIPSISEESVHLKKHKNNCSTESCRAKILRLVTLAQNDILPL